ncbi:MAG: porin, partial [Buchnera aphidicola]|nr:porin [Buchnera aphidicola]
ANLFFPEKLLNGHKNNFLRLGYAGIKFGDFGSIDYGRNYGVMHDAESLTNHVPYITNDSVFSYNDNYMTGRNNSLLTYRNNDFFGLVNGLSFALQYQDKNFDRPLVEQNGLGWGASFKYKSRSGLTAVGSLFSSKMPQKLSEKNSKKSSSVDAYGLGLKYDTKHVYLAAFYGIAKNLTPDYIYKDRSQPY